MSDGWLDYDPADYNPPGGVKDDTSGARSDARHGEAMFRRGYEAGQGSSSGDRTTRTIPAASRKVVGLMALAVIFTVAGEEIKTLSGQKPPTTGLSSPAKTILGGTIATALLSFASEAGPTGQQFAVGIATIAVVTSLFVNGGPVWRALGNLFGAKPTTPLGSTTPAGQPTTPTKGA